MVVAIVLELLPAALGNARPFLLLNGAVLVVAWYGGRGPALAAIVLATLCTYYFFTEPRGSFLLTPPGAIDLAMFVGEACLTAALTIAIVESRAQARGLASGYRQSDEQLRRVQKAYRALSACNEALVRAEDEHVLLEEICRTIVEVAGYRMCWVGTADHDEAKTVRPIARAGHDEGYVDHAEVTWADTDRGRGPVGTAIRTARPYVPQDVGDPAFAPWRQAALAHGYASVIALPLHAGDQVFGALAIYAAEREAFDGDAVRLLTDLCKDLAYGLEALHARAAVAAERARFEAAVMQAPVAVAVYAGPDHVVRLANRRWFALGRGLECIGKPLRDVLPQAAKAGVLRLLDDVYATGMPKEVTEYVVPVLRPDGSVDNRSFNIAYEPLTCAAGTVSDIIVAISDVTELVEARRIVEEARVCAEEASRAKDEFLRMISHELRSPLTPILALAETLKKKDNFRDPGVVLQGLDVILANARVEARIVDDLIDVSQFVAGKAHLEREPVELGPLVRACMEDVHPAASAKGVHIEASIAPDTMLWGDEARLAQAARHLLSNAVKFTPPGGDVTVEVSRQQDALVLLVHDSGPGIPPSELGRVFEPFRTGDASVKRAHGGLGLGLYLVRQIVEAHGGSVRAESEGPGKGTTLVAELPAPAHDRVDQAEPPQCPAPRA